MSTLEDELARTAERESVVQAWRGRHTDAELLGMRRLVADGPLNGWTLGVKDVIDTSDLPTERGSPIYSGRQTDNDAACVALARRAGALVVGKTATTEFALFTPTVTTNPHNPAHTPGGSSSGSAAAVADGHVRAAFGTQTVGSVLRPAAYCGVVGFKPTYQSVPTAGVATLSYSFDTVGWFTNTVEDAAVMFQAMTGAEPLSAATAQQLRIGHYRSHQWPSAQPEMEDVLDNTAAQLRSGGVEIVELEPLAHLEGVFEAADLALHYEIARVFSWESEHYFELISPLVQKMLRRADRITYADYGSAKASLLEASLRHTDFMASNNLDALLTPSAPGEAPPLKTTGDSVFNRVWTSLGVPALHLPTGTGPLGLPVGVQLAGVVWSDSQLLALGERVQATMSAP
ncbi:MAG: amidase family protein [Actinomycetota bacterium]|nr:amidase family protein [Actinomycetota bacterium]